MMELTSIFISPLHINDIEHRVFSISLLLLFTCLRGPQLLLLFLFNVQVLLVIITHVRPLLTVILLGGSVVFLHTELKGGWTVREITHERKKNRL